MRDFFYRVLLVLVVATSTAPASLLPARFLATESSEEEGESGSEQELADEIALTFKSNGGARAIGPARARAFRVREAQPRFVPPMAASSRPILAFGRGASCVVTTALPRRLPPVEEDSESAKRS